MTRDDLAAREEQARLRDAIERLVLAFPGYGYRRVTQALQREGWESNHKRVVRVVRQESLLCRLKRRFVAATDARHGCRADSHPLRPRMVDRLDQAWIADITSMRVPTTFFDLACVLAAHARRCDGWHLAQHIDTRLTLAALDRALVTHRPAPSSIHHADRGVQRASAASIVRLAAAGARSSMAAASNSDENTKAERSFRMLKCEGVYRKEEQMFADAQANLARFIDDVYNTKPWLSTARCVRGGGPG